MLTRFSAKSILLSAVSVLALTSAAHAADVVQEQAAPGFNWSGLYVGFGVGAGANVHEISGDILPGASLNGIGGEGIYGEATVGYDYMVSQRFLLGALLDAHVGTIKTSLDAFGLDADVKETYGFDVGVRAGYLLTPNTLAYVLGGYAWQKYKLDTNAGFGMDWDQGGYFLGIGAEAAINANWTLKGEYRYTRFSTTDDLLSQFGAPDGTLNLDTSRHTFQVAASYRFNAANGGAAGFETPSYNWTGFYVGGGLGAGASVHQIDVPPAGVEFNGLGGEGVFGEASLGYDQDFGSWVAGVMVDARYSGMTSELDLGGGQINLDTDYGFDVLGRVGMKVNEATLAYALAGYSWQHFDLNASDPIGDIIDWGSNGFCVGGGLETAMSDKMTVGIEYRYSQFEKHDFSADLGAPDGSITSTPSFHTVRIDAKYKFN
ncbi:porin family protein [Mesorhizobium sp. M1E.F.Ca.ET.045.02.1.1]|uniref:outer membrane protein n=1 Tax=unclassified Mesorhizobium TaxID=325217 RepID=UPI000F74F644|nr:MULTISPECIES: outer membrane beta-barrel protein [unclassified Mesorhizobium]AZO24306.1 porin family protein [Mesorhizobium sp. M1E.F.Ca.ET.045.02.1.1]RUW33761.1 porin family protein [Mesorhizobium sp. M1E.F.Ca.ET.041.01.1.1]RWD87188.1 MAG: porin family protein [Mesorhizobium sp.]TKB14092.1 MAG: porin family protein [Mesorhizobium sp.]